jgi:hypothetical protein
VLRDEVLEFRLVVESYRRHCPRPL